MHAQSHIFQTENAQESVRDRIDKEVKRFTGNVRLNSPTSNRADTALGLSILALATLQKDTSKANALLNLLRELGL